MFWRFNVSVLLFRYQRNQHIYIQAVFFVTNLERQENGQENDDLQSFSTQPILSQLIPRYSEKQTHQKLLLINEIRASRGGDCKDCWFCDWYHVALYNIINFLEVRCAQFIYAEDIGHMSFPNVG
jgi:hypothetical protein